MTTVNATLLPLLFYSILVVVVSALVVCACLWVIARGAAEWANAQAAVHRARAHGIEADMQRETIEQARDAATAAMTRGTRPPTPDEIRESILRQRAATNGESEEYREYTTSGDVSPDELNEHMQGGEFKQPTM